MRCSCSLLCSALLLLAAVVLIGVPAFSQDMPDVAMGMNPEATYHGGDFDLVDMATGRLNLHIPLVADHSQRGKLNSTYSLTFSSTGVWTYVDRLNQYFIEPPKYGVSSPTVGNDIALSSPMYQYYHDSSTGYSATAWSVYEGGWGVGGLHPLGTTSGNSFNGTMESIDGSGIMVSAVYNSGENYTVTNKEGLQFNPGSGSAPYTTNLLDTNGNKLTTVGPTIVGAEDIYTMTDTLGRTWTTTQNSTDVSGCPPGGPVAPTYSTIWALPGPNNGLRTFKFCYSTYNIHTNFNLQNIGDYTGTALLMTGVVLPDMTTWRLDYDNSSYSYGDLMAVYSPTGGHISYQWTTTQDGCDPSTAGIRTVASRTVFDGTNSNTWNYTWANGGFTVTDPMQPVGNDTVYTAFSYSCTGVIGGIRHYSGSAANGALLETITKNYKTIPNPYPCDLLEVNYPCGVPDPPLLQSTTTAWPNGQQSQEMLTYDSSLSFTDTNLYYNTGTYTSSFGLVNTDSHSDYNSGSPGSVLSTTNTSYWYVSHPSYVTANILDLPSSVVITNGSGYKCSETDYGYDVAAQIVASGVTEQHVPAPTPGVLGDLTSVTRQLSSTPCQSGGSWSSLPPTLNYVYDTGMLQQSLDPLSHPTTYGYSGTYYGAYPTTVTNALNQTTKYTYDFNSGLTMSMTDPNIQTTSFQYDDMLRPTQANYPDGGQTTIVYNYSGNVFVGDTVTKTATPDPSIITTQRFDGLGRLIETQLTSDPAGTDYTDITYDPDGRKYKVFNPTRCNPAQTNCGESTWGFTTYNYDPLNRVTSAVEQDGSTVGTNYSSFPCTTVTDETGKARESCVDGAGRMTSVLEDPGGLNYQTAYIYNALDSLISVSQSGSRQRYFAYDSLSRLTSATNPESNTVTYTYDANGNVKSKTDARNITTTYSYDALNRLSSKTYSDGTPSVSLGYDNPNAWGRTLTNTVGRLVTAGTSDSTGHGNGEVFSYDPMGRVVRDEQCIYVGINSCMNGSSPPSYNLAGSLSSFTNVEGTTFSNSYDGAGRLTTLTSSLSDPNHPGTLISGLQYVPLGRPAIDTLGNGITDHYGYTNRGWVDSYWACKIPGSTCSNSEMAYTFNMTTPQGGLGYAPNGNILNGNDWVNGNWAYSYDQLNRLSTASCSANCPGNQSSLGLQFVYDAFGNRWQQNVTAGIGPSSQLSFSGPTNRMDGYSYDAAGNLLNDGSRGYAYDAENRIVSVSNGADTYTYDATGRRVSKTTSAGTIDYLYDLSGRQSVVVNGSGFLLRAEIYAGDRHLGTYTNGTTYFLHTDWLGTERVRTDVSGNTAESCQNTPFGDAQSCTSVDISPMHFTGKERDSESGLDNFGARYDSSQYGRFMTPDWSAKPMNVPYAQLGDPQSLNLYSYVENNPLSRSDPDGHCPLCDMILKFIGRDAPPPPPVQPPKPPQFVKDNPTFRTVNQAGVAAARQDQQGQQQTGAEHANSVFGEPGAYTYTDPVTQGQKNTVDPNNTTGVSHTQTVDLRKPPIPPGTDLVGEAHSHPDNSGFSAADAQRASDQTIPSMGHPFYQGAYLGLSNGNVVKYDPRTGEQTTFGPGEVQ